MLWPMRSFRRADEVQADERCPHVLVRHADGTDECEGGARCGGDELLHDWALACHELACGCVGEEHDLHLVLAAAA